MNFDVIDKQMRDIEKSRDRILPLDKYLVTRLDGHGFTRLTKKDMDLEKPFDMRFKDCMVETLKYLMDCGFKLVYGYTQSDEISILFHLEDQTFGHKERKLLSLLASEASVKFSLKAGRHCVFDSRLISLDSKDLVVDYFRWRQEDCHRNSLDAHCYWVLRKSGKSAVEATDIISGVTNDDKINMLRGLGVDFDSRPMWERRGIAIYFQEIEKTGFNPLTQQETVCKRNVMVVNEELPSGQDYSRFLEDRV